MGFSVWHDTPGLLVFTLRGEIHRDDVEKLCWIIEERLVSKEPFGILTYAHRATRFASPDVRGLLLDHAARVRKVEHANALPTLLGHAVFLTQDVMPTFKVLQMQMGRGSVMQAFLSEEGALGHLRLRMQSKPLQKTWDFPFTEPGAEALSS